MKKYTLVAIALLLCTGTRLFAQKLEENKKDDFTNKTLKTTSWETLYSSSQGNAHFRIRKIDSSAVFDLKLMLDKVFSIDKDREIMFKLDNGEFVKLPNPEYKITCNGCGAVGLKGSEAQGISISYPVRKDQFDLLKAHKVVKVRIYTTDGFVEDDMKEKSAEKMIACLNLVSN